MRLIIDLHSHSGHAGGVGDISLGAIARTMALKGIDVFGTGDCLQPEWLAQLEGQLQEKEPGLFALNGAQGVEGRARFLLQSEIILTVPVASGGRKLVHTVLLFPSFAAARSVISLLERWQVKVNMGRPFVCCVDSAHVAEHMHELCSIDPSIVVIPAHIMTPQGVFGSNNPVDSLFEVFDEFAARIRIVETGLSADPEILALIPELDDRTLISNSDGHSAALNRIGREFTALAVESTSYQEIVQSLYARRVNYTAEFNPAEGRYFLTGHRAGKGGHASGDFCYFSPDQTPEDGVCPICGKPLTIGVLERALSLSRIQGASRTLDTSRPRQRSVHLVPLIEVIACSLSLKSITGKKVRTAFDAVLETYATEAELWEQSGQEIASSLRGVVPDSVVDGILAVKAGRFTFSPLGYDGEYGRLRLNEEAPWFGQRIVQRSAIV